MVANSFSIAAVGPAFLIAVAGSVVVGPLLGWLTLQVMDRVQHVPTAIILQFVTTFGVWRLAEHRIEEDLDWLEMAGGAQDRAP